MTDIVIETLGDLADWRMDLAWYCNDCGRRLALSLGDMIARWGRDQIYVQWRPKIRCAGCGGRRVSKIIHVSKTVAPGAVDPFTPR